MTTADVSTATPVVDSAPTSVNKYTSFNNLTQTSDSNDILFKYPIESIIGPLLHGFLMKSNENYVNAQWGERDLIFGEIK